MNKIFARFFVIFLFLIYSCKHDCISGHINPSFVGFSETDIDTVVIRSFKPNDNYAHLIDTFIVVDYAASIYSTSNDTTFVDINSSNINHSINPNYDWQIYIPAKSKTISISNILTTQTETSCWKCDCWNPINSFIMDGQFTSGQIAYIRN